jgi:hypothetical protein
MSTAWDRSARAYRYGFDGHTAQLLKRPAGCCVDAAAEHDLLGADRGCQQQSTADVLMSREIMTPLTT